MQHLVQYPSAHANGNGHAPDREEPRPAAVWEDHEEEEKRPDEVLATLRERIRTSREKRKASGDRCLVTLTEREERALVGGESEEEDSTLPLNLHYDKESRQLFWKARVIKNLSPEGARQHQVLSAFEDDGWLSRTDDPLCPVDGVDACARLRETVRNLNKGLQDGPIHFESDGTGEGIRWAEGKPGRAKRG